MGYHTSQWHKDNQRKAGQKLETTYAPICNIGTHRYIKSHKLTMFWCLTHFRRLFRNLEGASIFTDGRYNSNLRRSSFSLLLYIIILRLSTIAVFYWKSFKNHLSRKVEKNCINIWMLSSLLKRNKSDYQDKNMSLLFVRLLGLARLNTTREVWISREVWYENSQPQREERRRTLPHIHYSWNLGRIDVKDSIVSSYSKLSFWFGNLQNIWCLQIKYLFSKVVCFSPQYVCNIQSGYHGWKLV